MCGKEKMSCDIRDRDLLTRHTEMQNKKSMTPCMQHLPE